MEENQLENLDIDSTIQPSPIEHQDNIEEEGPIEHQHNTEGEEPIEHQSNRTKGKNRKKNNKFPAHHTASHQKSKWKSPTM